MRFLVAFDHNLDILRFEGWGTDSRDWPWDVDVDSDGFIYAAGITFGDMAAPGAHKGLGDGFITKFDPRAPQGQRIVWTRQIGTDKSDELRRIRIVGNNIYVSGHTYGSLPGFQNAGQSDAWVAQLDRNGNVIRQYQVGTGEDDRAVLAAGARGVYIGGYTFGSMVKPNAGFIDAYVLQLMPDLAQP